MSESPIIIVYDHLSGWTREKYSYENMPNPFHSRIGSYDIKTMEIKRGEIFTINNENFHVYFPTYRNQMAYNSYVVFASTTNNKVILTNPNQYDFTQEIIPDKPIDAVCVQSYNDTPYGVRYGVYSGEDLNLNLPDLKYFIPFKEKYNLYYNKKLDIILMQMEWGGYYSTEKFGENIWPIKFMGHEFRLDNLDNLHFTRYVGNGWYLSGHCDEVIKDTKDGTGNIWVGNLLKESSPKKMNKYTYFKSRQK